MVLLEGARAMMFIRALVWTGIAGWCVITLNFLVAWIRRRTVIRFLWVLGAAGAVAYLLSRVVPTLPYWLRLVMDLWGTLAGMYGGAWLVLRFASNPRVLD
jgi:energy-coupling factor transporter transmembrane protein EcfT